MTISRTYPISDLESMHIRAVANGWLLTVGFDGYGQRGGQMSEQFVFSTREAMAKWMVVNLPDHEPTHLPA